MLFNECNPTLFTFINLFSVQLLMIVPFRQAENRVSARLTCHIFKDVVSHMGFQACRIEVSFPADLTYKRLLLCVNCHVFFNIDCSGEMLFTYWALDTSLCMNESVSHESGVRSEPLPTHITNIWIFSSVYHHVELFSRWSSKRHRTKFTFIRSDSSVGPEVFLQSQFRHKHFR